MSSHRARVEPKAKQLDLTLHDIVRLEATTNSVLLQIYHSHSSCATLILNTGTTCQTRNVNDWQVSDDDNAWEYVHKS